MSGIQYLCTIGSLFGSELSSKGIKQKILNNTGSTSCECVSSSATQSDYHQCDVCPDTIFII